MAPLLIANEATIIIIVLLALVLFGGSRIAGGGKGAGRAIREFKEETAGLNKGKDAKAEKAPVTLPVSVGGAPSQAQKGDRLRTCWLIG